jgi:hypothetical protein
MFFVMQLTMEPVQKRAVLSHTAHAERNESRLRRYAPLLAPRVRALASRHERLADLAVSFPALLFALAMPRSGSDPAPAIARAIEGACLAELAEAAGIPMWLRKLPPEAFVRRIGQLPDGKLFRRRIANHMPSSARLAPVWLQAVADAAEYADELAAVWVAREVVRSAENAHFRNLRLLRRVGLYAWFSGQPKTLAHVLIDRPWKANMHFSTAVDAAHRWHEKIDLHLNLGGAPIADTWLGCGFADGYEFVPIQSAAEFAEEAEAMANCLAGYGYDVAHGWSRFFSVRKGGKRVATLNVARGSGDPLLNIEELRGLRNKAVSAELSWAARRWLHHHELPKIDATRLEDDKSPLDRLTWIALWRPYWLAKQRIPDWLPLRPTRAALRKL